MECKCHALIVCATCTFLLLSLSPFARAQVLSPVVPCFSFKKLCAVQLPHQISHAVFVNLTRQAIITVSAANILVQKTVTFLCNTRKNAILHLYSVLFAKACYGRMSTRSLVPDSAKQSSEAKQNYWTQTHPVH